MRHNKTSKYKTTIKIIPPNGRCTVVIDNNNSEYELHFQCVGEYKRKVETVLGYQIGEQRLTKAQLEEIKNGGALLISDKNQNAVALGSIKTPRKASSSKKNGALGGRPRKHTEPTDGVPLQSSPLEKN